ncbi:MAG TPA: YceI family protein [Gammaproteobacteria bacterium]|nr:YceI family protein [Gammaproteobacteria bacterium]
MKLQTYIQSWISALNTAVLALALLAATGCAGVAVKHPTGPVLAPLPPLVTSGATHYIIRSRPSDIVFLVYRAGPLAAFGHNHVLRASGVHGDVYLNRDFMLSGFTLSLPLTDLRVDAPADRAAEGADFATQPSAAAIAGTLHNMLGPAVLDAAHYPDIRVRSLWITGSQNAAQVMVRITLHGVERELSVPLALNIDGKLLSATGHFDIRQSDFGITPFSILGGGLRVADTVKVRFHIVAARE